MGCLKPHNVSSQAGDAIAAMKEATQMNQSQGFRRYSFLLAVSAIVLLVSSWACAPIQTTAVIVEPGVSFTLAPGQTATVRRADARVTFREVREDSRCPVDVTCVWAGDAKIDVTVTRTGAGAETKTLSITPPDNEVQIGNLKIRFVGLTPVPRQADGNTPRNYLAEFVVDET
jgi:type III secretory pathway component EscS